MNQAEIVNASLTLLARNPIGALTDASTEARVATTLYETVYALALSGFRWSFASTSTAQLSKSPLGTADGFDVYPLPAGWFALTRVYLSSTGANVSYKLEDGALVTLEDVSDADSLHVEYTRRVDEGLLPGYFTAFFVQLLAAWMALPLTESPSVKDTWEEGAEKQKKDAQWVDASSAGARRFGAVSQCTMVSGR